MKVVLTGIGGFIGGHLADRLVADGAEVLGIDNFSFGRRENVPVKAMFHELDLATCSEGELFALIRSFAPDHVIHFAAIHFIPYCMAHPDETFASNVRGTEVMVRALEGLPVRKLVFASTMDVYAAADRVHQETDEPAPSNVYGLSKLMGETLVAYAARVCDPMCAVSLRFANIFGPRETNPHLVPDILDRLRDPREPEIRMGNLAPTRDFLHVEDLVEAIISCLSAETGRYACFNVGSGVATPVRRVVELLKSYAGDGRPVREDPAKLRNFDRPSLSPDISKIHQALGWQPGRTLETGLEQLVEYELRHAAVPSRNRTDVDSSAG